MNAQKLSVKLYLKDPASLHGVKLVPVFQSWIQLHAVEDHLAIDVADYEHVPDGPGTVLVTHEANFSLDATDGRPGLQYQRKQPLPGTFEQRLAAVIRYTLQGAARLEENPGLAFATGEILVRIADRLLAPNNADTYAQVRTAIQHVGEQLFGAGNVTLEHHADPAKLFAVTIKSRNPVAPFELLNRLPSPLPA